jgi:hypothetical protein
MMSVAAVESLAIVGAERGSNLLNLLEMKGGGTPVERAPFKDVRLNFKLYIPQIRGVPIFRRKVAFFFRHILATLIINI